VPGQDAIAEVRLGRGAVGRVLGEADELFERGVVEPDPEAARVAGGGAQLEHEPLGGRQAAAHRQQVVRR